MLIDLLLFIMRKYAIIFVKRRPIAQRDIQQREKANICAKIRYSIAILHFNQHSITFWGIPMCHSAYKREKYTFICANMQVVNTILKVNRDNRQT